MKIILTVTPIAMLKHSTINWKYFLIKSALTTYTYCITWCIKDQVWSVSHTHPLLFNRFPFDNKKRKRVNSMHVWNTRHPACDASHDAICVYCELSPHVEQWIHYVEQLHGDGIYQLHSINLILRLLNK